MKRRTLKLFAFILCTAVLLTFIPLNTVSAGDLTDIPSGYVIFDGSEYFLIYYEDLFNSYTSYLDDPDSIEATLTKFYFDTLDLGFDSHFIAYLSSITNKYVSFGAVLEKYIETKNIDQTYTWFNTDEATSAFDVLTQIKILGTDGSVTGSLFVDADGYRTDIVIVNPSVETADSVDPSVPANWSSNSWGSNTAVFTYLNEGHTGSRSVKVEVTGYVDGDAKWYFDPIELEPRDYVFSNYYRSDVDTKVILAVTTDTGDTKYLDLPIAPASEEWTSYEASFTMPDDGETITVYHVLSRDGYLITDDYKIDYYNYQGFDRGLLTITFDDGWEENTETALPVMQQYGFKSTQFYATTYIENPWPSVSNPKELIDLFINDGHEIGSHSITHPDLTTLSEQEVVQELEGSKQFLQSYLGIDAVHFATPYGAYNTSVKDNIMQYYDTHRTVDSGYNSKDNFDVSRLRSMSILSTTTADEVAAWAAKAKEEKLWVILLYHRIADDPGDYDTTPELFAQQMQAINDAGIPVVTVTQAVDELEDQL